MYCVFFAKNPSFSEKETIIFDNYVLMAFVKTNKQEKVFELCNTIDSPWIQNPEVTVVSDYTKRSISVGDIIQDLNTFNVFQVSTSGFIPINF